MFKNFITIALRNFRRQVMYSFLNLFGLAIGMACSLVIFLYVYGEWSHDRHFLHGDRIYRIGVTFYNMGSFARSPEMLGDYLPKDFEGIETFTHFQKKSDELITVNDQSFEELVYNVDSSFFDVFSYAFVKGNPNTAMQKNGGIVLTERMARKYFGEGDAVGKTLLIGKEKEPFVVTGIVKNDDRNSHLKASVWLSRKWDNRHRNLWPAASVFTYVKLREQVTEHDLRTALDQIIAKYVFPALGADFGITSLEEYVNNENSVRFVVHPLKDIYLRSKVNLELSPGGNETNVYVFGVVAVFILILAAVNFINLSTARATRRAKEVGIRKSLGTTRLRLVMQFLMESVMISGFSMIVALCLSELFSFVFYWITGQQLPLNIWNSAIGILGVITFTFAVGILAGIYPAFYLTSFQPVKVLKGNLQRSGSQTFRNMLVVLQFSISIGLIICTTIIVRQLHFMSNKDLGFDQENIVSIDNIQSLRSSAITFREELLRHADVVEASLHTGEPGSKAIMSVLVFKTAQMPAELSINSYFGDSHYLDVMGFQLIKGRNFNKDLASDSAAIILNESAVRAFNIQDNPIGTILNGDQKVIGVVRDFHWESLRNAIAPAAILLQNERKESTTFSQLALKVKSSDVSGLLKVAETKWKQLKQDEPLEYHFMDDNFGLLLQKEEVLGKVITFFTVLAILISCLGLFGLAAYTTEQRTKEIGIRKVLGASIASIVMMLNKQFTRLVIISILIAVPLSYIAADQWLSGFAYRTTLSFWIFAGGGVLGLCISCVTVAFHSIKASQTNPSETLKCE